MKLSFLTRLRINIYMYNRADYFGVGIDGILQRDVGI
jgi:hypothetical protein